MAFHLDLQSILFQFGRDPFCRSCPNSLDSMFYHTCEKVIDSDVGMRANKNGMGDLEMMLEKLYSFDDDASLPRTGRLIRVS